MKPQTLLRLYPHAWRERYAPEVGALLESQPITWRTAIDVGRAAMSERLRSSEARLTSWQRAARLIIVMCGMFVALNVVMTIADVARFQHRMATPADFGVLEPGLFLHALATRPNAFIGLFNLWLAPYVFSLFLAAVVRITGWSRRRPLASLATVALGWPMVLLAIIATRAHEWNITLAAVGVLSYFGAIGFSVWWALFRGASTVAPRSHEA